jgi:hypothetical protein
MHRRSERRTAKRAPVVVAEVRLRRWVDSPRLPIYVSNRPQRPVPCGSGRKFKRCCLRALDAFFLWDAVSGDIDSSREFGTTFDPFFVFSFVPDAAETDLPPDWPTEPVALHFLQQEVESCSDFHREFIEQACKSHPSFFVVESTAPGRSISKTS